MVVQSLSGVEGRTPTGPVTPTPRLVGSPLSSEPVPSTPSLEGGSLFACLVTGSPRTPAIPPRPVPTLPLLSLQVETCRLLSLEVVRPQEGTAVAAPGECVD